MRTENVTVRPVGFRTIVNSRVRMDVMVKCVTPYVMAISMVTRRVTNEQDCSLARKASWDISVIRGARKGGMGRTVDIGVLVTSRTHCIVGRIVENVSVNQDGGEKGSYFYIFLSNGHK